MNFEIAGKTAVVTAGSLGIGKATALSLAKEGANVAICGRDEGNLAAAVQDIQSQVDVNILPPLWMFQMHRKYSVLFLRCRVNLGP